MKDFLLKLAISKLGILMEALLADSLVTTSSGFVRETGFCIVTKENNEGDYTGIIWPITHFNQLTKPDSLSFSNMKVHKDTMQVVYHCVEIGVSTCKQAAGSNQLTPVPRI